MQGLGGFLADARIRFGGCAGVFLKFGNSGFRPGTEMTQGLDGVEANERIGAALGVVQGWNQLGPTAGGFDE